MLADVIFETEEKAIGTRVLDEEGTIELSVSLGRYQRTQTSLVVTRAFPCVVRQSVIIEFNCNSILSSVILTKGDESTARETVSYDTKEFERSLKRPGRPPASRRRHDILASLRYLVMLQSFL
jgi:hypothetical protein